MPNETKPATSLNGLTANLLAASGRNVAVECGWDGALDIQVFEFAAALAISYVDEAITNERRIEAQAFPPLVSQWFGNPREWKDCSVGMQLIFEVVGRLWVSLLTAEPGNIDVAKAEQFSIKWFMKRVGERNGHSVDVAANKVQYGVTNNGSSEHEMPDRDHLYEIVLGPNGKDSIRPVNSNPAINTKQKSSGATHGFRRIISDKINEHMDKAAALEALLGKIGPESDEALWEIFSPFFKGK